MGSHGPGFTGPRKSSEIFTGSMSSSGVYHGPPVAPTPCQRCQHVLPSSLVSYRRTRRTIKIVDHRHHVVHHVTSRFQNRCVQSTEATTPCNTLRRSLIFRSFQSLSVSVTLFKIMFSCHSKSSPFSSNQLHQRVSVSMDTFWTRVPILTEKWL